MNINWCGQSCFKISVKDKDTPATIIINPFSEETGLKLPKLEGDILLVSKKAPDYNNTGKVAGPARNASHSDAGGNPFLVNGPGEYEIKKIFIQGIVAGDGTTIYVIDAEDIRICLLAGLSKKQLDEEQLETVGDVDILLIPVGGGEVISAKEALEIMSQIEPSITIPIHYDLPKLNSKLDKLEEFLKAIGVKSIAPIDSFSIKKKDISKEEAKIIVLNA